MPSVSTSITCAPRSSSSAIGGLDQLAPAPGHGVGLDEIVEVAHRKAEVAVKRVDENFEGLLQRLEVAPRGAVEFARRRLGLDAEAAQVAEHLEEHAERGRPPARGRNAASATDTAKSRRNAARCARRRIGGPRCSRPPPRSAPAGRESNGARPGRRASSARRSWSRSRAAPRSGTSTEKSAPARSSWAEQRSASAAVSRTSSSA